MSQAAVGAHRVGVVGVDCKNGDWLEKVAEAGQRPGRELDRCVLGAVAWAKLGSCFGQEVELVCVRQGRKVWQQDHGARDACVGCACQALGGSSTERSFAKSVEAFAARVSLVRAPPPLESSCGALSAYDVVGLARAFLLSFRDRCVREEAAAHSVHVGFVPPARLVVFVVFHRVPVRLARLDIRDPRKRGHHGGHEAEEASVVAGRFGCVSRRQWVVALNRGVQCVEAFERAGDVFDAGGGVVGSWTGGIDSVKADGCHFRCKEVFHLIAVVEVNQGLGVIHDGGVQRQPISTERHRWGVALGLCPDRFVYI